MIFLTPQWFQSNPDLVRISILSPQWFQSCLRKDFNPDPARISILTAQGYQLNPDSFKRRHDSQNKRMQSGSASSVAKIEKSRFLKTKIRQHRLPFVYRFQRFEFSYIKKYIISLLVILIMLRDYLFFTKSSSQVCLKWQFCFWGAKYSNRGNSDDMNAF